MRHEWWSYLKLWRFGGQTSRELSESGRDQFRIALELWRSETTLALEDAARAPAGRFMAIRYEEFVADPIGTLGAILDFCGLERCEALRRHVARFEIRSGQGRATGDDGADRQIDRDSQRLLVELGYA
jgi:hypothetical protein